MREKRILKLVKRCISRTPKGREGIAQEIRIVHSAVKGCRGGIPDAMEQEIRAAISLARLKVI